MEENANHGTGVKLASIPTKGRAALLRTRLLPGAIAPHSRLILPKRINSISSNIFADISDSILAAIEKLFGQPSMLSVYMGPPRLNMNPSQFLL